MLLKNLLKPVAALPATLACDVLVVGGGSGGLACAQAAAKLFDSVILLDYVRPSDTKQTTWGLGGTCVNVGCVPKKLFHRAGYFGQCLRDGELTAYGFQQNTVNTSTPQADWPALRQMVQNHVKMLNFTYRNALPANCQYINAQARFDSEQVKINNGTTTLQPKRAIVIAVGGRPTLPGFPGAELGLTSDDVFSLQQSPNKTLVVGSSYIGLETASFLAGIGCETTLLVRSRPLRGIPGFDADCAERTLQLVETGNRSMLTVKRNTELVGLEPGITATFADKSTSKFDTVLFATGRRPEIQALGKLPHRVNVNLQTSKIKVNPKTFLAAEATATMPAVYAIGDCAETESPELTPVAIRQAELVAKHIANEPVSAKMLNSLQFVPSTVFALPSEYSRAGMSEQEAVDKYGAEDIEVYWRAWEPLETGAAHTNSEHSRAFVKLVCVKSQDERVVGLHLITPNSSEVIHGLALSMALGACKSDFDAKVLGIHPTDAEALCDVTVTKASGKNFTVSSGCGGGKCG